MARAEEKRHETDIQIRLQQNDLDHDRPELTRKKRDLENAIAEEEIHRQIFEEELCRGPGQPGRGEEPLWRQAEAARDHIRQKDRNLGPEDLRTSLEKNMRIASTLNTYRIGIQPLFASEEGRLRSRVCIELYLDGQRLDLLDFIRRLESQREVEEQLLSREDRRLFETILNQTIITKLSHRINSSQEWTQRMSGIMEQLNIVLGFDPKSALCMASFHTIQWFKGFCRERLAFKRYLRIQRNLSQTDPLYIQLCQEYEQIQRTRNSGKGLEDEDIANLKHADFMRNYLAHEIEQGGD